MAQFGLNVRIRSAPICTGRWLLKEADRNDVIKNGLNIEPLPHSFNIFTNATRTFSNPNAVASGIVPMYACRTDPKQAQSMC
jgi:hypothetical protein